MHAQRPASFDVEEDAHTVIGICMHHAEDVAGPIGSDWDEREVERPSMLSDFAESGTKGQ